MKIELRVKGSSTGEVVQRDHWCLLHIDERGIAWIGDGEVVDLTITFMTEKDMEEAFNELESGDKGS